MTGPLIPVILGTGAIGAAAYFICSSFQDDAKPNETEAIILEEAYQEGFGTF